MKSNNLSDYIIKNLKIQGFKITDNRRILIDVFLSNVNTHFNFEELFKEVRLKCPSYGIATLYRNLKLFVDVGILSENIIDDVKYYELKMFSKKKLHAHLICKICGSIDEYHNPDIIKYIKIIDNKYNFDVYYGELNFYGICNKCKLNNKVN